MGSVLVREGRDGRRSDSGIQACEHKSLELSDHSLNNERATGIITIS